MVPLRIAYILAALLLVMGAQRLLGSNWRRVAAGTQRVVACAGLLLSCWLVLVEILIFRAECWAGLAGAVALTLAFGLGFRAVGAVTSGAVVVLGGGGLAALFVLGTIPKVFIVANSGNGTPSNSSWFSSPESSLVVQEFADFQCPACAKMDRVLEEFLASKEHEFRFEYRHLPLTSIHPFAERAAVASECAGRQRQFSEVKRTLFGHQTELGRLIADPENSLWRLKDVRSFRACLERRETQEIVDRDVAEARRLGLRSTPSVLIGRILVVGATPGARLRSVLELARQHTGEAPASGEIDTVATACGSSVAAQGCAE
jgi:predicted DsbA family dithiol-disulfide isomerase